MLHVYMGTARAVNSELLLVSNGSNHCDGPSLGCRQKCGFGPKAQRQSEGLTIYVYYAFDILEDC